MIKLKILDHAEIATRFFMPSTNTERGGCPACDSHMTLTVPKKRSTVNAVQITTKQHKRRHSQTESYHKKVQKRWDKRAKTDPRFQVSGRPKQLTMSTALLKFVESHKSNL